MTWREPSFSRSLCFNLPQLRQATLQLWLTYRSCSVDDRCHCGQGSCIPFQAFMGTLKWQWQLRSILSWTLKKCLIRHVAHPPHTFDVLCEDALNILAQTLLSLPKEAFHPINLLPTALSFLKSCYLNHRSQEALFCILWIQATRMALQLCIALQGCFHGHLLLC